MYSLASLALIRQYANSVETDISNDMRLAELGYTATAQIEAELDVSFARSGRVDYFDTQDTGKYFLHIDGGHSSRIQRQMFWLTGRPLVVGESTPIVVTYDSTGKHNPGTVLVESEDYYLKPDTAQLFLLGHTGTAYRAIKVSYTGGYTMETVSPGTEYVYMSDPAVPSGLRVACAMQTAYLFDRITRSGFGAAAERSEEGRLTIDNILPLTPETMQLLRPYQLIRAASL